MDKPVEGVAELLPQIVTICWVSLLSGFGGAVGYLNRMVKSRHKFNFVRFIVDILTSAFVGIVTFMLCDYADFNWQLTAALVAVSGHMGTKALEIMESRAEGVIRGLFKGYDDERQG